jgi:hypothetical protein
MTNRCEGLWERRCITRQDVGHQRSLVVGAVYTSESKTKLDLSNGTGHVTAALRHCVDRHPFLSFVIIGGDGERPEFASPKKLDLSKHLEIRHRDDGLSEDSLFEKLLAEVSDEQFTSVDSTPPWKLVLVPLPAGQGSSTRLLALFAYYHSHGDGKSGLAFHQSFFEGLNQNIAPDQVASDQVCEPCLKPLPPPMEKAGKLSLSWSFLLSPVIGVYLPSFLASMLGFRASWITQSSDIWHSKALTFDPNDFRTGLTMLTIDHDTMRNTLQRCKSRQTTFTGLLNHLIARAISENVSAKAFATQIVIDLRHLFQGAYTNDTMINSVSAYSETVPRTSTESSAQDWTDPTSDIWTAAQKTSAGLKEASSTLHNQPIGLLAYLNGFRAWTLGQIGKPRECSYEISNLVVFDPVSKAESLDGPSKSSIKVEKTIFSQPANAAGSCLCFNLVSTKGGPLVMTVTWQRGVLDLGQDEEESEFVRKICSRVEGLITELATAPL